MQSKGQAIFGLILVLAGLAFLAGQFFNVNLWSLCWPAGLIALGVWFVLRPRMVPGAGVEVRLIGDVDRRGAFPLHEQEIWTLIGDVRLDLTQADIPPGETRLRIYGLIGDVDLLLPPEVGAAVYAAGLFTDTRLFGRKADSVFTPVEAASENYPQAERRLRLETYLAVGEVKVDVV